MAEQGGGAVGGQHGSASLSNTRGPAGAVSSESQAMEWLSVPDCMDFEPSFLQGNSEVTIDADVPSYVHTDTLDEALEALQDKGLVVLCGPPGSGKTTLGRALLRHYRNKDYKPFVFTSIEDWHRHVGQGRKTIVLMDGMFGHTRVKQKRQEYWDHIRTNVVELIARGDCRLVITVYPHVLHELQRLERGTHSPLLDPSVIVHTPQALDTDVKKNMLELHLKKLHLDPVEQRQLVENIVQKDVSGAVFPWCCDHMVHHWHSSDDPTAVFTRPAETYVHLLTTMLCDKTHGETMAAVFALAMRGLGRFLQDSRSVQPHLKELRFHDSSEYRLEEHAYSLKGSVLAESGYGFTSRVLYDAVGLALGRSFSLPVLLKVCDVDFFVKHIQKEFHPFSVSVDNDATTGEALLQMVFDLVVQGWPDKICQSALFSVESFLQEFDVFIQKESNRLQRFLFAEDGQHSLTVLYWSAWNCNSYLSQWCLKSMEGVLRQGGIFSHEDHLKAVIAIALLHASSKITGVDMRCYLKEVLHTQFCPSATERLTVRLPLPGTFLREETCRKLADLKVWLQSPGVCYLDDPSLPIPATLLSVTVTEDAVSVELPSQHWYLAPRLLADREVDETDRDGNTLLHIAADKGNLEAITLAVKSGASLTKTNNKGLTPYQLAQRRREKQEKAIGRVNMTVKLYKAISVGDEVTVKTLLCCGSSIHDDGTNGNSFLIMACQNKQENITHLLIDLGTDVNVEVCWESPPTLLHHACYNGLLQTVELLVKRRADISARNQFGETALHYVCQSPTASADITRLLLDAGADVNARDDGGRTPLHHATGNGNTETMTLLIDHGADLIAKDTNGRTPLHHTYSTERPGIIAQLIEAGAETGRVHQEVVRGDVDALMTLLQQGADVNQHDNRMGCSPLHAACLMGRTDIVTCLTQHGAKVDDVDDSKTTPLYYACQTGVTDIVTFLTQKGAMVNSLDDSKTTPLHVACETGATDIVTCLIQHGAQVDAVDCWQQTPLHVACKTGVTDIVTYMIQNGANVNELDDTETTPLHIACTAGHTQVARQLIDEGADVNARDEFMSTPLHGAADKGNTEIALCLIKHGAHVDAADFIEEEVYETPLQRACSSGHTETVQCLLQHGANVNSVSWYCTPLHAACSNGHTETVQCLLQHGADVNAELWRRGTPLDAAIRRAQYSEDLVTLLVQHGAF